MSLASWQAGLVDLVARGAPRPDPRRTDQESAWFAHLAERPGTTVTRAVAASWRAERLSRTTALSLLFLSRLGLESRVVAAYGQATMAPSSYLVPEGLQFLDFVERIAPAHPHLRSILELERAILLARAEPWVPPVPMPRGTGWLDRQQGGAAVVFDAEPRELLVALATGAPLPAERSGTGSVLVGPGLDAPFRVAHPHERRVLAALEGPRPYAEVVVHPGDTRAVEGLVEAGVVRHRLRASQ